MNLKVIIHLTFTLKKLLNEIFGAVIVSMETAEIIV